MNLLNLQPLKNNMMKKILLTVLVISSFGILSAQQLLEIPKEAQKPAMGDAMRPGGNQFNKKVGGAVNGWYAPLEFVNNNSTVPFNNYIGLMHWDSTVKIIDRDNAASNIFYHAMGHTFDLRDPNWTSVPPNDGETILQFAQKDGYSWDSVAFRYVYRRNFPNPNVVDTCFVHYYKNTNGTAFDDGALLFGATNEDTVAFGRPNGYNVARLSGTVFFDVDTVLLTIEDTTRFDPSTGWGQGFIVLPVGTNIVGSPASAQPSRAPRSWFGATFSFKPGHPYNVGDTAETQGTTPVANGINYFGSFYRSLTAPPGSTESALPAPMRTKYYGEGSNILNRSTRYGQTQNGWQGFIPGLAFFSTIFIDMQAYVTGNSTVSVAELEKTGVALGGIYPNPASNGTSMTIDYASKTTQSVSIEVFDMMGKKVATVIENNLVEAGNHTASFNVDLQPGMYFYTLTAGDVVVGSKKFMVAR